MITFQLDGQLVMRFKYFLLDAFEDNLLVALVPNEKLPIVIVKYLGLIPLVFE